MAQSIQLQMYICNNKIKIRQKLHNTKRILALDFCVFFLSILLPSSIVYFTFHTACNPIKDLLFYMFICIKKILPI